MKALLTTFIGFALLEEDHFFLGIVALTYSFYLISKLLKTYGH